MRDQTAISATFLQQLACMVPAGIPIANCFDILEKTQVSPQTRALLYKIKRQLLSGHNLCDSLSVAPNWFDAFTCQLIKLGERTGKLEVVLRSLAEHHEKKLAFHRKIKQALFYPCILLITATLLTVCMFIFVIPAFEVLFNDTQTPLPLITRIIFRMSHLFSHPLFLFACLVMTGLLAYYLFYQKRLTAHLLRYLGPINACLLSLALIHFARHLSIALSAGIPILDALGLTAGICHHQALTKSIRQLRASLSAGRRLHQAMEPLPAFPLLLRQMTKVGEEAGSLDAMLLKTAYLMETELDARLFQFTQLLEPLIMSVLGVLIGGLVIGMYLPIFNLGSTL